jgi:PAS domain S-box-containing protein
MGERDPLAPVEPRDLEDERFRLVFESSPCGMALVGLDGRPLRCNSALQRLLGYSEDELSRMVFSEFTHPDDVEADWSLYNELRQGLRTHYRIDKRYLRKDGGVVWAHLSISLVPGDPPHVLAMVEDTTVARASADEQRRLVRVLGERIKELSALHQIARVVGDDHLSTTEILSAVARALPAAFQYPESAAARIRYGQEQSTTAGFVETPWRLRKEQSSSNGTLIAIDVVYLAEKPSEAEGPFLAEERHLLDSVAELVDSALVRRHSQERLSLAVTATGAGVWEWDIVNGTVAWSEHMHRIGGLAPKQFEGTMKAFEAAVHPEDRALLDVPLDRDDPYVTEYRLMRPDGECRWVTSVGQVFRDAAGRPVRMLGLALDATARHRLEEQLRQAQKMEAVGNLAAGVAHDFNNLLSVVLSYSEFAMQDVPPTTSLFGDLEEIRKAGVRAAELTRQLLAFSRQQILQPRVVDLNQIVAGIENMVRRLIGEDVTLSILPDPKLAAILADPGQIEQVIVNLVVNARDAMPKGGTLVVAVTKVELHGTEIVDGVEAPSGSYVALTVADSGIGMSSETKSRIFEPFFTTKEKGKGTGLGLATVFGIVRQSGGHIAVDSQLARGTTFKVYLPRVDRAPDALPTLSMAPASLSGSETVLLVEDEEQVRVLARTILQRNGYTVLEAQNGGEAFLICEQHAGKIDLVITDVVMPRMSGRQLVERLAPFGPLKVLYMSGYTDDSIMHHGVLEQGVEFLQKPLTPDALLRRVREVLATL